VNTANAIDAKFFALADPTRRALVERLSRGPSPMKDLAEPFLISLPTVLKHLAILEESGMVQSEKAGRVRTFSIPKDAFADIEHWVSARKRQWNRKFDRLEQFLDDEGDDA
jgi:DNA-binding transcriptional ArsR family regulator